MADSITVTVSKLKTDITRDEIKKAFSIHGYVKDVTVLEPDDATPEERSAVITFSKRSALEAAGDALATYGKEEPHELGAAGSNLKVRLAEIQPHLADTSSITNSAPLPSGGGATPQGMPMMQQQPAMVPPPSTGPPAQYAQQPQQDPSMAYGQYGQMAYGGYGGHPSAYGQYPPYGGMYGMPHDMHGGRVAATQLVTGAEVKLFVGGLPYDCNEMDLRGVMQPYGTVVEIHLMKPSESTQQRCAFVTFEHHVSALAATKMGGVHRMSPNERPIVVRFADTQGGKRQRSAY